MSEQQDRVEERLAAFDERLAAVESRLRATEDHLEITRLLTSYGPLVDAGQVQRVGQIWTEDGEYDVEGWHMRSRADIEAMVVSDLHQNLINTGSLHFMGPAWITLQEDRATAVCESLLVLHHEGRFRIVRGGAHVIGLVRTDAGWRVRSRKARTLDGAAEARAVLATPTEEPSAPPQS